MKRILFFLAALLCIAGVQPAVQADLIKRSGAYTRTVLVTASSDHITGLTGATLTVTGSKNGAAFAALGATVTEIANGRYKIVLTTTDTNTLGPLDMYITATSADPTDSHDQIVAFDPSDSAALGLTAVPSSQSFPANFSAMSITGGGAVTAGTVSDKTGYALTQAFPTNFSTFSIDGSGFVALKSAEHTNIAADVLNANAATYNSANTIGAKINAAGGAADPWAVALPGAYGAGTAGRILGLNLDALVSSRLASSAAPTNWATMAIDGSGRLVLQPSEHTLFPSDILGATAASYNASNSIGAKINSAGSAGDPLANAVPGVYATGSAGSALGKLTFSGSNILSQVAGYSTGQDPVALLQAMAVDGSITWKQAWAIQADVALETTRTWNATTHTAVLTSYRRLASSTAADMSKPIVTKSTVYAADNVQVVSQTITLSNLP